MKHLCIFTAAKQFGDIPALRFESSVYSYKNLAEECAPLCRHIQGLPGDRLLAIRGKNHPDTIMSLLTAFHCRRPIALLHPKSTADDLAGVDDAIPGFQDDHFSIGGKEQSEVNLSPLRVLQKSIRNPPGPLFKGAIRAVFPSSEQGVTKAEKNVTPAQAGVQRTPDSQCFLDSRLRGNDCVVPFSTTSYKVRALPSCFPLLNLVLLFFSCNGVFIESGDHLCTKMRNRKNIAFV